MIEKESLNFHTHFLVIYDYYKAKFIHSHKKERFFFYYGFSQKYLLLNLELVEVEMFGKFLRRQVNQ